jgi:hypothetical protein
MNIQQRCWPSTLNVDWCLILEPAILLHEYSTKMLSLHFEHWSMFDSWTCHIASWIFNKDVWPPLWMLINIRFLNLLFKQKKMEVHHPRLYANCIRLLWGLKFWTWALRKLKAHKLQPTSIRVKDNRGCMYVQWTQWLRAHNVVTSNYLWFGLFVINCDLALVVAFIF